VGIGSAQSTLKPPNDGIEDSGDRLEQKGEVMGTWGTGPFDDDQASDWVWELQEAKDWGVVMTALRGAADAADAYLEAPDGQIAWAAAAVVAAADDPGVTVPEEVSNWLASHRADRPSDAGPLASKALQRITSDQSELVELWEEAGDEEWRANIKRLAEQLQ
jgi:hypothetical protein